MTEIHIFSNVVLHFCQLYCIVICYSQYIGNGNNLMTFAIKVICVFNVYLITYHTGESVSSLKTMSLDYRHMIWPPKIYIKHTIL